VPQEYNRVNSIPAGISNFNSNVPRGDWSVRVHVRLQSVRVLHYTRD